MYRETIANIFNPKTIAVFGATNKKEKVGYAVFRNLIGSDFDGVVYPINPKRPSVQGVKCYQSLHDVPEKIDLAVIATPAPTVPSIIEECGRCKASGALIISAGFKEAGKEGKLLTKNIMKLAKQYNLRIIGPNCLGFIRPSLNLNASFAASSGQPGSIAFISQSGALGTAILDWANSQNVGFRYFVSIGEMIDMGFHDLIDFFGQDPEVSSILIYMESLTQARRFMSAARSFARTKPIIILKAGQSDAGAKAAMSHTGSLAGNSLVYKAAFRRAGIIQVDTITELFDCAKTLDMQKRPAGNKLAIVTNAGGPGVIATDCLMSQKGELAKLSPKTLTNLATFLPSNWSKGNPIDVLGDATPEKYRKAVELCIVDPCVDGILVILTPQSMTDPTAVAKEIVSLKNTYGKTILASWMGGADVAEGIDVLEKGNIPAFETPEHAAKCFVLMHQYSKHINMLFQTPSTIPHAFSPKTKANKLIITNAAAKKQTTLNELEARKLLSNYGIPVATHAVAHNPAQAAARSTNIGFPVAMKVLSSDILHKTDVGGVQLDIKNRAHAERSFASILKEVKKNAPHARIEGVLIEKMISKKYELLIGSKKDPLFGPVIMFGMGGVAVQVFKDTNIGLPPLNMALAMQLMQDTKIFRLLKGYRGMAGVDIKSIQFLLYKFAYLVMDFPEIKELDINPFAVDDTGGVVLDAKVVLDEKIVGKRIKPYSHLVISPYPKEYITQLRLKHKRCITLRPIKPEDEPLEAEMFKTFSDETQRFRFFTPIKKVTHDLLVRYTQNDYDREIGIVGETKVKGKRKMVGVARLIGDAYNETAEFAIVVGDPWQHLGLGSRMTDYVLKIAKRRGIKRVFAYFLKDNLIIKEMFKKKGFTVKDTQDTCYAELDLR